MALLVGARAGPAALEAVDSSALDDGSAQMAGQNPALVSGICALTWTYQPPLGSGFFDVSTPLSQL